MSKTDKKGIIVRSLIGVFVLIACGAMAGGIGYYRYAVKPAVKHDGYIYIPTGATYSQLLDSVSAGEYFENIKRFGKFGKRRDLSEKIRPGRYELKEGMTYRTVIYMLASGHQKALNVTFNNIRTKERLAAVVSKYIEADSAAIIKVLNSDTTAARYGYRPETFIGMFIPNTYQFYWNTSATEFLDRMKKENDAFWNSERTAKLEKSGFSKDQVITIASIVAEETRMSDEMPRVAGVYVNRLRIGMPLQADPTVKFAIGDFSLRRILHRHLTVDSPYNTYKNKGLPPGPICMPSIKAIDAVLNYENHNYIYFCAKEDFSGYHNFAKNLSEHNANARRYSAALNARGIR